MYQLDPINYFISNTERKWVFFTELQTCVSDACFCCLYCFLWKWVFRNFENSSLLESWRIVNDCTYITKYFFLQLLPSTDFFEVSLLLCNSQQPNDSYTNWVLLFSAASELVSSMQLLWARNILNNLVIWKWLCCSFHFYLELLRVESV